MELVTIYSENQRIFGDLHLPYEKAPCVITLQGLESSKESGKWPTIAYSLYNEGYACLRFNFQGLWVKKDFMKIYKNMIC